MNLRLALDVGTNSIGWSLFKVPSNGVEELVDLGVRVFSDSREPAKNGRMGDSLSVNRRLARQMRKTRDRKSNRKRKLIALLKQHSLLPEDSGAFDQLIQQRKGMTPEEQKERNPYYLRAAALERPLPPHAIGRIALHLAQRRGYASNRKTDAAEDPSKLSDHKKKMLTLHSQLQGGTLGQFLWRRWQENEALSPKDRPIRAVSLRFRPEAEFFPTREMLKDEWDRITAFQRPHHQLDAAVWDAIGQTLFFQWPLRPVERGWCSYLYPEGQRRAYADLPVTHAFRIQQEINNLRYRIGQGKAEPLSPEQKQALWDALHDQSHLTKQGKLAFSKLARLESPPKHRIFPKDVSFNLESDLRKDLQGNIPELRFAAALGDAWLRLDGTQKNDLVESLYEAEQDSDAVQQLSQRFGLTEEQAQAAVRTPLRRQTVSVSRAFMERALPVMRDKLCTPIEAAKELGLKAAAEDTGERVDLLPYYGELLPSDCVGGNPNLSAEEEPERHYGRIPNPTVHAALNQMRRLVNGIIGRYGRPAEIHVELARELKLPRYKVDEITRQQSENRKFNETIRDFYRGHEMEDAGRSWLVKYKLWERLGKDKLARNCLYSGTLITEAMLLNGDAEIEHILPFSRTLDDSLANLTLAHQRANRVKRGKTPYEAFGDNRAKAQGFDWDAIQARVEATVPKNQQWRFREDALKVFEEKGEFIQRQLTDTAYIAKVMQRYLRPLVDHGQVQVSNGRLTALLRAKWGLNKLLGDTARKERNDHRHHAVDAFVVGLTTRSLLKQASDLSRQRESDDRYDHFRLKVPSIDHLRAPLQQQLERLIVSRKPDHGRQGKFYQETAYGLLKRPIEEKGLENHRLVTRKAVVMLKESELEAIRDSHIRKKLLTWVSEPRHANKKFEVKLAEFSEATGIRRLRLLVQNQSAQVIPSARYKAYVPDSYACVDIYRVPKARRGKWSKDEFDYEARFRSYVDMAHPPEDSNALKPHPAAKFCMRLFKDDSVSVMEDGHQQVLTIAGFSTTNDKLDVRSHTDALGVRKYVSINVLMRKNMRKLHINPDGSIKARGQHSRKAAA